LVVFFLPYGVARATGHWSTSGKFDGSGTPITATGRDTAEIKGWMTFGEISRGYNVSLEEIADNFKLPREKVTADQVMNKVESEDFSVSKLREWLDSRKTKK
ncbi:MAG TPA: hypothetical protein VHS06_00505, partial [Chloroflexota bacterium]|nr:hypothetical protein [Chloroflexota bacterium]